METRTYYDAINWTDGIKLTKNHFIESYFNGVDTLRDTVQATIHTYDYGLLESREGMSSNLKIKSRNTDPESLVLELHNCHAITAGGCKIEFTSHRYGHNVPVATVDTKNINKNSDLEFYVIVVVNPFELVPVGEPDPEVIPLHHPYVLPKVSLEILTQDQLNNNFLKTYFLMVKKVYWRNGIFTVDDGYTPPVSRIMYHESLKIFYNSMIKKILKLKEYAVAVNKRNRDKVQHNKLIRNTFMLNAKLLDFISQNIFELQQIGEQQPPIYIAQKMAVLANYLSDTIAIMEEEEKQKLLQYYYEWINVKPSEFQKALGDVIQMKYDHQNIDDSVDKIKYFINILDKLWKRLSDLEYIGQRKDNIVVSEESSMAIRSSEAKDKSWSIID